MSAKSLTDIYVGVKKNDPDRKKSDLYPTPPLATYTLVHCLKDDMPKTIIEPCAGRGHISKELTRHGFEVISYDLNDHPNKVHPIDRTGVDAQFLVEHDPSFGVVTNPPYFKDLPYKLANKFVREYDFTAFFVRLTYLEGKKRNKLFTEYAPSDIIYLSDRINFGPCEELNGEPIRIQDQIGGMIAYMWIVWNKKSIHENTRCHWVLLEDLYNPWFMNWETYNAR